MWVSCYYKNDSFTLSQILNKWNMNFILHFLEFVCTTFMEISRSFKKNLYSIGFALHNLNTLRHKVSVNIMIDFTFMITKLQPS